MPLPECLPRRLTRRVAIVLTICMSEPGIEQYCNDSNDLKYGQSSLCKIRNERNFRNCRPKAAQVAVKSCMARSPARKRQSTRRSDLNFVLSMRRDMHIRINGTKKKEMSLCGPCV